MAEPRSITEHRCNHCGWEYFGVEREGECARCGRTFFVSRRICNPAWVREQHEIQQQVQDVEKI